MAEAERAGSVAAGGLRHDVQGRDQDEVWTREEGHEPSAREDRRLNSFTHLLTVAPAPEASVSRCVVHVPSEARGAERQRMEHYHAASGEDLLVIRRLSTIRSKWLARMTIS